MFKILFIFLLCSVISDITICLAATQSQVAMERILHGAVTDIKDRPYQVALVTKKNNQEKIICGGALVNPKVIFTAAHCTHIGDEIKRPNLFVLLGANSISDPEGQRHKISKVIKHPKFTYNSFDNDFSVILLKNPARLGSRVQTIPIGYGHVPEGSRASVSGWGLTEFGTPSHFLKSVGVTVEDFDRCQNHFPRSYHPEITTNFICIKPDKKGTSFGDSGSPLVLDGQLVGLVSFGRSLGPEKKVTVFTKVKNFVDFVDQSVPNY